MNTVPEVRPSPIAGLWYSDDPHRLALQVDEFIAHASVPNIEGNIWGLIAPHAGLRYSGQTAGYAFATVSGQERDLVVVLSPMHEYHPAPFITTAHHAYATPLGKILVDRDALGQLDDLLRASGQHGLAYLAADPEHSLEIELPFLQRVLHNGFQLLPIMVRSRNEMALNILGSALASILEDRNALLVASTDLSHFYPERVANQLDKEILSQMEQFSPLGVLEAQEEGRGFACGASAVASMLWAAESLGANTVQVLHHSTSAEETGDSSSVVGYGAAVVYEREQI